MLQRMETFELMRPRISISDLCEEVKTWERAGNIEVALSAATGSTVEQNQALRISSTHRGLTQDDVRVGDKFGGYIVDYVITGTRYTQLFLTKEESL